MSVRSVLAEPALALTLVFCALLRLPFHVSGLTFDADANMWQMQDVAWLRDSPVEAIWHMHMQPPLLNVLYAVSLQLPAGTGPLFLQGLFLIASALMVAMIYVRLRWTGASMTRAATLAALFGALPQILLYENVFGYQHFEALLILAAALLAGAYLSAGRPSTYGAFAACVVGLALLRSQYHVGWVALVLFAVLMLSRRRFGWRWRPVAAALLATAIVGGIYVKNYVAFGSFTASSWFGMTTANMVTPFMPGDQEDFPDLQRDVAERTQRGEFSPAMAGVVAEKSVWWGWVDRARDCPVNAEKRPELCQVVRSTGLGNFNHQEILRYSRQLGGDAAHLLRLYPIIYLDHLSASVLTTLGTPSWDYRDLSGRLGRYSVLWNHLMGYTPGQALDQVGGSGRWWHSLLRQLTAASLPLMIAVVLSTGFIFVKAWREGRAYWRHERRSAFWLFPALALMLMMSVPHLINGVETQRIRYTVEPILYLALIDCLGAVVRRVKAVLGRRPQHRATATLVHVRSRSGDVDV